MDQQAILAVNALANAMANNQSWSRFAVEIILMIVVSGGAAFGGSYFKKRGENLATKADFDALQNQLQSTTRIAEQIRSEFQLADWKTREAHSLRRVQIERAYEYLIEADRYLHEWWKIQTTSTESHSVDDTSLSKLQAITGLYFPAIEPAVEAYASLWRDWILRGLDSGRALQKLPDNAFAERQQKFADDGLFFEENYPARRLTMLEVAAALRSEMHKLLPPEGDQ